MILVFCNPPAEGVSISDTPLQCLETAFSGFELSKIAATSLATNHRSFISSADALTLWGLKWWCLVRLSYQTFLAQAVCSEKMKAEKCATWRNSYRLFSQLTLALLFFVN